MDGNIYRIETLNDCDFVKGFNINDQQPFIVSITKVQATFDIAHWLPDKSGAVFCAITGNNGGDLFYVPAKFVEQVPSMLIALVIGDYSG
jgi:hypothetical protein